MLTRRYLSDGAKYWGPLTSVHQVRSAVRFIASLFQLRTCKLDIDKDNTYPKPCLDYHLKLCSGPCAGLIEQMEYRKLVGYAVEFFSGHYQRVLKELQTRMWEASERQEYENAARYRDLIEAAEKAAARQRVVGKPGENLDVVGIARSKGKACVLLMPMRDGRLIGERKYILNHRLEDSPDNDVLAGFIKLHYANPQNVPEELVLPYQPADEELLKEWLARLRAQGAQAPDVNAPEADKPPAEHETKRDNTATKTRRVAFTYAKRAHKAELLAIAMKNATERLHTELLQSDSDFVITPGQKALSEHLELASYPRRVEGYDIANLQGKQATGAMVVFQGGRKAPGQYRLFNIRLKDTPDDYAMIRETLRRRLHRLMTDPSWETEIDLIMIDGGKGQLNAAQQVFSTLLESPEYATEQKEKVESIKLVSLAKQEELVYHYDEEGRIKELRLPHDDEGLRLLVAVRNEAHRFSNLQHTRLRDKAMRLSVLDTIPGLGPARRAALLNHFGSGKRIREASTEELAKVKGIGTHFAKHIRRYLDRDSELEEIKAERRREMRIRRIPRPGNSHNL